MASRPGWRSCLVGEDPASKVYVANKAKQTVEVGMNSWEHKLPAETPEAELLALVEKLNADPAVHGILVQLPLPKHIDSTKVLDRHSPAKDVDGFHVVNVGMLSTGQDRSCPARRWARSCWPRTCWASSTGCEAVVIGRSNIVGKPVAQLLLAENCTVTIAHSRTQDLPGVVRRADLVIAAVGRPEMVKGDWLKPGAMRHRRRHQPHRARRQGQAGGRLRFRQLREGGRRHHPGARRRRPHDDRLPALQHGQGRLRGQGDQAAGDVSLPFPV